MMPTIGEALDKGYGAAVFFGVGLTAMTKGGKATMMMTAAMRKAGGAKCGRGV